MATTTRPRSKPEPLTHATGVIINAKAIHSAAKRKATRIANDASLNRSTARQRAQRIKADAFDEIGRALAGK